MDVREKLVELIEKAEEQADKRCDFAENCDKCLANNQKINCLDWLKADCLLSLGVTVQEWKPISEPPKEKGTYLVCTDNGGVLLGHWYGTAWNAGGGAKKHLACWMEKPQPPKGE